MKPAECGNCGAKDMSYWGMWGDVPVCHHCSISPMKIAHTAIERAEKAEAALTEALRERDEARALVRGAYEDDCGLPWWFDWARQQGRPLPEWATDGLVEFPWPLRD